MNKVTLSVELPAELEKWLSDISKKTDRTKDSLVCEALKEFLGDQEDYFAALEISQRMKKNNEKSYSFEEVLEKLGISEEDLKNA